ncbi:methyltransferase [Cellulomonas aerilata]|uniref:Methylase n=1 Tax=Cellulomonas aerilata TaxID=515326 RepID=A0A512D9T4_9CELL|nr:methyltransferase [Cellulomonas aerilata]GEO33243.1 methylase [Cellulomonas aerilata]
MPSSPTGPVADPPGDPRADDVVARLRAAGCVFAEEEAALLLAAAGDPDGAGALDRLVGRRVAGEPLEHVLGWVEFCGLRIAVEPGVFVPRRRTEVLVREAAALLRAATAGLAAPGTATPNGTATPTGTATPAPDATVAGPRVPVVVDLCCGSGAIGTALAVTAGPLELHAADVDAVAVRCARRNVEPVGGAVHAGDLDAALPASLRGRVDVLVVNAPYVPTAAIATMPPEARTHEPRVALDGGADGLDVARRVVACARRWLAPEGHLLVETSERQAPDLAAVFRRGGLVPRVVRDDDLAGTVVLGRQG